MADADPFIEHHEAIRQDKTNAHTNSDTSAFNRSEKGIEDSAKSAAKLTDKMPSLSEDED